MQPVPLITAAYRAKPESVIVAEVSTFQLEKISGFKPKIAALLNVSADHLDRHANIKEYAALKAKIFEYQDSIDFSIINTDNPFTASLKHKLKGRVLEFSLLSKPQNGAYLDGKNIIVSIDNKKTVVCKKTDIRIRGQHNLENVLAASCISIAFGVQPKSIIDALKDFTGVHHRLESVAFIDGVEYINNSMCTNVDAAIRSIEAISEPQIVIAGGKDKGADYKALGKAFAKHAKYVVLIGADAHLLKSAALEAGFDRITKADSLESAVRIAKSKAAAGDVIVLTPGCASFDMFSSFEDRGNQFKQLVKKIKDEV